MKKRITLVLSLMCFSTVCLISFQLYWNYQAYHTATRNFKSDINDALKEAVRKEATYRKSLLSQKYESWLADSSLILINAEVSAVYKKQTRFTIEDKYPPYAGRDPFPLSFDDFTEPLNSITPGARTFFINRFIKGPLKRDLDRGVVYYYTQRLGDSLNYYFNQSKVDLAHLQTLYKKELEEKQIQTDFKLLAADGRLDKNDTFVYATRPFETYGRIPAKHVKAWFPDPNAVFIERMKWVLLSSLFLMAISLYCFYYTITTLLHQKKLADLKSDFVNNMTHELKTPVATIGVASEAIEDFNLDITSTKEYAGIIREQSANLSRLIDQILDSAIEEETAAMNMERVCLKSLMNKALLLMKPQIEKKGAVIESDLAENVYVLGNETHLTNVIVNLLDNALKYSMERPCISVSSKIELDCVILQIADNGIGIDAKYQQKVFDRFFRVPTGNIHTVKGYGLGLTYARSVIEKHKGSLSLKSKKDDGTKLIVKLPVYL